MDDTDRGRRRRRLVCTVSLVSTGVTPLLYAILISLLTVNHPVDYQVNLPEYNISVVHLPQFDNISRVPGGKSHSVCYCHVNETLNHLELSRYCVNQSYVSLIKPFSNSETTYTFCPTLCCSFYNEEV
jgi:hypothetical protein